MKHIRNSAKAIIISGNKVLLTKNKVNDEYFYLFPGGGQEHSETIHDALIRECIEEVGYEVKVRDLLHVREYIGKNHEHFIFDRNVHQIEYYFVCSLVGDIGENRKPSNPDNHQVGIEWIDINDLLQYNVYPKELRRHIIIFFNNETSPVYLGDIN
jgi:8-oxo-dGTP diphosphatase